MKVIALLLVLAALPHAVRAEESFENAVEEAAKTDWRKELLERLERERAANPDVAPPARSTGASEGQMTMRFQFEDPDKGWREGITMTMTLKTFERYQRLEQRYEDDARIFGRDRVNPENYFSFGGRDAAAIGDVLFTGLSESPFVQDRPWLDVPVNWLVEGMRLFERFDRGSVWDVFGFEVDDWIGDRFGVFRGDRGRAAPGYDRGALGGGAPALGMTGPVRGSPDGDFHGRLRVGVSGLERAATKFDADPIRFKVKYEIKCPRSFVLDRVEVGGEFRPFCRDERSNTRVYIGGAKSF